MDHQTRSHLQQFYDEDALKQNLREAEDWKLQAREEFAEVLRRRRLAQGSSYRLLELGSGTGRDAHFWSQQSIEVICLDFSPEMVKLCQGKGLTAHVYDFTQSLNFEDSSMNAVYCMNSLLHVPKKQLPSVLTEIRRVLMQDGVFYCGVYGGRDFEGPMMDDPSGQSRFFALYTDDGLKKILSEFFRIVSFASLDLQNGRYKFQSAVLTLPS
ncbi:unnamed protein product [Durusdinium trenchii]|uniref:Methyltransferase domain-containing protein n=2 Tax=Durusdinium trenchii TaxID=1381693 RepID=A0ABP0P5B8_9DINO